MDKRDPEGYRKLLAYQKAHQLHQDVLELVRHFPSTKTYKDLDDQMSRSGRSGHKNIVEGWKRNTTQEYYNFLGYSIGAIEELKDDAADIATGLYKELLGIKGIMGEKGIMGFDQLDALSFYPLNESLPPAVKIYLKAKEANYLLYKLQESLDSKMTKDHTKPASQRWVETQKNEEKAAKEFSKQLQGMSLLRLENGKYVSKDEWEALGKPRLFLEP